MVLGIIARRTARMGVAGRTDTEFAHAADGVDGVVLPMAIAAHDEEIVRDVGLHPAAKLVAFVGEVFVGMVVALIGAIGANHGGVLMVDA